MLKAHPLTAEHADRLRAIYSRFCARAVSEYRWDVPPAEFEQLMNAVGRVGVFGCWVEDTTLEEPVAFMLYCLEAHKAVEINVIYSEIDDHKTVLDRLMRQFILDVRELSGWDVVSYPMLGTQEVFIRTITWYGFKPSGQAIVNFDFLDSITLQIFQQQQFEPLPPGYRLDTWKPEFGGATANNLFEAFKNSADAKWDPRFRTLYGAKTIVSLITGGMMGTHLPDCTAVVLKNDVPVGFCFIVQTGATTGNIPLIGVHPDEKKRGLGKRLLHFALSNCIRHMVDGKINMLRVNATMNTDNISAIKMYRRLGFKEEYNYPHVYLTREKALAFKPGQWCQE
jgi:ribosomal protein S18 acetylase RimI-like enzyme